MPKNQNKKKGGSVASNRVNAFVPNFTSGPCKFKSQSCTNNTITNKFATDNYGSFFKTQGGKKQRKTKRNNRKKGGNNQFDTFKNYPVPYLGNNSTSNLYNISYKNVPLKNSNIGGKKSKKNKQKGSSRSQMPQRGDSNPITGSSIPPTWAQGTQNLWNGVTSILTDKPSNPTYPSGLQLACNNNDCNSSAETVKYVNNENNVLGFRGKGNFETINKSQGLTFPQSEIEVIGSDLLPTPRAGGKKKSKKNQKKKNKKSNKKRSQGGSNSNGLGSDFQTTLAARGPYNYPNSGWHWSNEDGRQVAYNNFRAFNKTSQYIPPRTLSNGAALMHEPPQQLVRDPNYSNPWITTDKLTGYNDFRGISTQNFNGAGRKMRKNKNTI